jgi:Glycosyl transferase family 2
MGVRRMSARVLRPSVAMTRPDFSIITVCKNQGALLPRAIESVMAQGIDSVEHIVIDLGSTDDTDSVLQRYPHVKIIRQPDISRAYALNTGTAMATGSVISWLSPSDQYAPGAFYQVLDQVERHPVVMGACEIRDERGTLIETVENVERSWFDTMKYWVAQAVPTQPAIFLKRSLLSELDIEQSEVFDEGLHLAMEYDLWLRIQERFPFSLRVSDVLAIRHHEQSPSRAIEAQALAREMSRIFRRHAARRVQPEQNLSFVVPLGEGPRDVDGILSSVASQTLPCVEVVFVDYAADLGKWSERRSALEAVAGGYRSVACQFLTLPPESPRSLAAAIDLGIRSSRSHVVCSISSLMSPPKSFGVEALQCFSRDEIGLILPSLGDAVMSRLFTTMHGTQVFNPSACFSLPKDLRLDFLVRKLAWIDTGGFALHDRFPDFEFSVKRLLVMLAHKAWRIVCEPLLPPAVVSTREHDAPFRLYENSVVVDEIAREMRRNPFSIARARNGFGLVLSEELWQRAQSVIHSMPINGGASIEDLSAAELQEICAMRPNFSPALYCLADALAREGALQEARQALAAWRSAYEDEKRSPLFGDHEAVQRQW